MKTLETPLTWILTLLFLVFIPYAKISADKLQAAELAEKIRAEARALLIAERTITVEVSHDSNPATNIYSVILSAANSFDAEGDSIYFAWDQSNGATVNLGETGNSSVAKFDAEAGEYEFVLSVSDSYGATCVDTVIVSVQPEPNSCPNPIIQK
jgi:hypothetical protein